ncbi:Hsp33 family molecular chaperone HslO [Leptolyngbya sp. 7M]|uniref:Hsp33 family molecular chaperone HslO n=1 Tax=Leptolyngbya sp. 7M TaxID=2812896 RepID=UPI001CECD039
MIHGIAADGTIRVLAATTTNTTAESVRRHETSPTVSAALGRTLTGALLLGATQKDFDRLTLQRSSDPIVVARCKVQYFAQETGTVGC